MDNFDDVDKKCHDFVKLRICFRINDNKFFNVIKYIGEAIKNIILIGKDL